MDPGSVAGMTKKKNQEGTIYAYFCSFQALNGMIHYASVV